MERVVFLLAPTLTSIQLAPQVYKTFRTRNVSGLSVYTFLLAWFASVVWGLHGYYTQDIPVMVSSVMTLAMDSSILCMLYLFG